MDGRAARSLCDRRCGSGDRGQLPGRPAGGWGDIGCFSFYPTKNLGGMGDGGMLTASDEELADRLQLYASHGMEPRYYHQVVGINSRLGYVPGCRLERQDDNGSINGTRNGSRTPLDTKSCSATRTGAISWSCRRRCPSRITSGTSTRSACLTVSAMRCERIWPKRRLAARSTIPCHAPARVLHGAWAIHSGAAGNRAGGGRSAQPADLPRTDRNGAAVPWSTRLADSMRNAFARQPDPDKSAGNGAGQA